MATIRRLDDLGHRDQAGAHEIIEAAHGLMAFDVGANIGTTAKVLAANFHRVIALEPCQESFDVLLVETPPNVVPLLLAATDHSGEVELTVTEGSIRTGQLTSGEGLSWGRAIGARLVPSTTIDDLVVHYGHPDFLKMDVEGHEVEVMQGWSRPHGDVLIEVHRAEHETPIRELYHGALRKLEHAPDVGAFTRANHFWLTNL